MYLVSLPVYRTLELPGVPQYVRTTEIIGYQSQTLEGRTLAHGKTRLEAIMDGLEALQAEKPLHNVVVHEVSSSSPLRHTVKPVAIVGNEVARRSDMRDQEFDRAIEELFRT